MLDLIDTLDSFSLLRFSYRHAGYRPIEVNASDERSASALVERVTRAMESSTLNIGPKEDSDSKAGRPNCIILDEVDGADAKSSIAALVDIIRADIPPSAKRGGKKGGHQRPTYLRRPIILICNHKHYGQFYPIQSNLMCSLPIRNVCLHVFVQCWQPKTCRW